MQEITLDFIAVSGEFGLAQNLVNYTSVTF